MSIFGIVFLCLFMISVFIFGLVQWRSTKSDFMEKFFGACYVVLSVLVLIGLSIGILTGSV